MFGRCYCTFLDMDTPNSIYCLEKFIYQNVLCLHWLTPCLPNLLRNSIWDSSKTITYCERSLSYAWRSSTSYKFFLFGILLSYITLDEIKIHNLFYELFFVAIGMKQQTHLINLVKEGSKMKVVNKIKGRTKLWEMNYIFAEK